MSSKKHSSSVNVTNALDAPSGATRARCEPLRKNQIVSASSVRRGFTTTNVLLVVVAVLLAFLIVVSMRQKQQPGPGGAGGDVQPSGPAGEKPSKQAEVVEAGKTITRGDAGQPKVETKPANDPNRLREVVEVGKTYRSVMRAGFDARVDTAEWGTTITASLAYAAELIVNRKIEENDGKRIVEVRHIEAARNVKVLCKVDSVSISLGVPGEILLGGLAELITPGSTVVLETARQAAQLVIKEGAQAVANDKTARAVAGVSSLHGKTARIEFVDGKGVVSVTPIGCSLTQKELDFFFDTATLTDYHIMPDLKLGVGSQWTIPGAEFASIFLDPSLHAAATGEINVVRRADAGVGGKELATLAIESGKIEINSREATRHLIGKFVPSGTLRYSLSDQFVSSAELAGDITYDEVSTDHLLFETRFRTQPKLRVQYHCEKH